MTRYYRDEKAARRNGPLVPVASEAVDEGYRLVGPDGTLTPVVVHVQWLDNHPDGPDTHVMISFDDGTAVEFPFGTPLTAVWHEEDRPVTDHSLRAATPPSWGTPAPPWNPH